MAEAVLPYIEEVSKKIGSALVIMQSIQSVAQVDMTPGGAEGEPAVVVYPQSISEIHDAEHAAANAYLSGVSARLGAAGVAVSTVVGEGDPADSILDEIKKSGIQLIAISTHGRSGVGRAIMGSVADRLIRDSGIPVLVIRPRG